VRLESGRLGLARDTVGGWALLRETLIRRGYLLLPLVGLIVLLVRGVTPAAALRICGHLNALLRRPAWRAQSGTG
jgi:hypothetical protein